MKISQLAIFSLLILTISFNCNNKTIDEVIEVMPPEKEKVIKYLALGDSYTIGESVNVSERYPIQLSEKLINDNIDVDTTIIIAKTGWRTDNLIDAIEAAKLTDTFDLVTLLIGVNNQYQRRPIAQYESEFDQLLNTAIRFAGGDISKVVVLSIPDYGYTPFGKSKQATISAEIDQYNAINKRITEQYEISWFDITPISREAINNPALVAADGLHPSGEMYRQWVELIYESVKGKLNLD